MYALASVRPNVRPPELSKLVHAAIRSSGSSSRSLHRSARLGGWAEPVSPWIARVGNPTSAHETRWRMQDNMVPTFRATSPGWHFCTDFWRRRGHESPSFEFATTPRVCALAASTDHHRKILTPSRPEQLQHMDSMLKRPSGYRHPASPKAMLKHRRQGAARSTTS